LKWKSQRLGNGNDDLVIDNLGGNQVVKLGTGTGDSVNVSTTASGTTVTTAGADATITFGVGNNEIIKALGGGSTLNFMGAGTGEVAHLSNSGGNTVNVGSGGGSITIDGLAATDACSLRTRKRTPGHPGEQNGGDDSLCRQKSTLTSVRAITLVHLHKICAGPPRRDRSSIFWLPRGHDHSARPGNHCHRT